MGPATTTGRLSPALRNSSPSKDPCAVPTYWAHEQGLQAEARTIDWYHQKQYVILEQRVKTPFAEVDLLFETPEGHLLMVEVKSVKNADFIPTAIGKRQKQRLQRAMIYLTEQFKTPVEVHWAFVSSFDITVIEDITSF